MIDDLAESNRRVGVIELSTDGFVVLAQIDGWNGVGHVRNVLKIARLVQMRNQTNLGG